MWLVSVANAQDGVPGTHIRFITLGELYRLDRPSGLLHIERIPKGVQPPIKIRYSSGGEMKGLDLPLRQFSPYATFKGDDETLILKNIATDGGGDFLKFPAPKGEMNLGVLFANHGTRNWLDPKILMLKDDAKSFPTGEIRFVNASDHTVLVEIEGHPPFKIKEGSTSRKTLKDIGTLKGGKFVQPLDDRASMKLAYRNSKNVDHELYSNNLNISKGTRIQCFFFKSKKAGSAKGVKHVLHFEKLPSVPEPPKRPR